MIYIDPPYGIKYSSNFQPFVSKRNVTDGKDADLTQEPEMIKAFRDTWELGIHSYLSYLRDRLLLSKQLLAESGSVFVQISSKNLHHVLEIMSEVFGSENFVNVISYRTTSGDTATLLPSMADYIVWFAKDRKRIKFHQIFLDTEMGTSRAYNHVEEPDGTIRKIHKEEIKNPELIPKNCRIFTMADLHHAGSRRTTTFEFEFKGRKFHPGSNHHWKTNKKGMDRLKKAGRLVLSTNTLRYKKYFGDFPATRLGNMWIDTGGAANKKYVVQTSPKVIQRCMLMVTDPGDLVLDPTCGGGTTAFVAEQWGRRWITCDTSRVALALTKQRLMTVVYDYYRLHKPDEGVSSGFLYKTVQHKTLRSIANDEPPDLVTRYDKPITQSRKTRISGPFTIEAVPAPTVKSLDVLSADPEDYPATAPGASSHQQQWRDELLKTGIRGKSDQRIEFTRVEPHPATKWLHADAETKDKPKRAMVSFGPEHAPLEQRQVENAIKEAQTLVPPPEMLIFAAMQFDPEAAKDIDELNWPGVTTLKVEMNKDLLTSDLKTKRASNESFWLMGQPDVEVGKTGDKHVVTVNGFDYYNTKTGEVESGDSSKISMWMLDEDYDGRSVYPKQIFFPMEGDDGGWIKLAKTLRAQIDEDLIHKYHGTTSIPFEAGPNKQAAVKIIDYRGIESLKVIHLEK